MKERPIPFSGPMVEAIRNGKKTMTRRIVKLPKRLALTHEIEIYEGQAYAVCRESKEPTLLKSPYGEVGDTLWVKESLIPIVDVAVTQGECMPIVAYEADGSHIWTKDAAREAWRWKVAKLPSIYMPRRFAREFLIKTGERVERLHQISSADCIAEGFEPTMRNGVPAKDRFHELWVKLNGPESWNDNPAVRVVEFKRIEP